MPNEIRCDLSTWLETDRYCDRLLFLKATFGLGSHLAGAFALALRRTTACAKLLVFRDIVGRFGRRRGSRPALSRRAAPGQSRAAGAARGRAFGRGVAAALLGGLHRDQCRLDVVAGRHDVARPQGRIGRDSMRARPNESLPLQVQPSTTFLR